METTSQDGEAPRLIKRYANRKLYDTRDSRYVTLNQIATYVREGEEVTIIDNTTKEDLTRVTLAQILYEEEKKGTESRGSAASAGTLRELIQQSGERLMSSLRDGPVGKLMARKEGDDPDEEVSAPVEEPEAPVEGREGRRSVFSSPKEVLDELQRLADDRIRGLLGHAIFRVQQLQGEVGRLQARIEELEETLVKLNRREEERSKEEAARAAQDEIRSE